MTTTDRIKLLLDLGAKEATDDIRQFFAKDCVDITCASNLKEVEIELGFRSKRSTPKPDYAQLYGLDSLPAPEKPENDYAELFLEREVKGKTHTIVDEWWKT
jgi:hypothetical protein